MHTQPGDLEKAGQTLAQLRADKGWSQARLAAEAGCSIDQVKFYETGQRRDGQKFRAKPEVVATLANALGGGYREMVLKAYDLPVIPIPEDTIDLSGAERDQIAAALELLLAKIRVSDSHLILLPAVGLPTQSDPLLASGF